MAQTVPSDSSPLQRTPEWLEAGLADELAEQLCALRDSWIVLRNRHRRATDGPPWVDFVLLHPRRGVALVNAGPGRSALEIPSLRNLLAPALAERNFGGHLPIVALEPAAEEIPQIENLLAAAFAGTAACSIEDGDWSKAALAVLSEKPELRMLGLEPSEASAGDVPEAIRPAATALAVVPPPPIDWRVPAPRGRMFLYGTAERPGWRRTRSLWMPMASLATAVSFWVFLASSHPLPQAPLPTKNGTTALLPEPTAKPAAAVLPAGGGTRVLRTAVTNPIAPVSAPRLTETPISTPALAPRSTPAALTEAAPKADYRTDLRVRAHPLPRARARPHTVQRHSRFVARETAERAASWPETPLMLRDGHPPQ